MSQQITTVRIFISSTFKDMHSERDYIIKYVFPELKERCIKKGLALVDVDLRWGVTEEEAEQGKAIEICLDEIENCKPFFIGILGERYGWTPESYQVPDYAKYDWLKEFEKGHSITALEIYHGVLNKKEMKPRAFFYFRNPGFIKDVPEAKQPEVKAESGIAAKKLFHLKEDIKDAFKDFNIPGHIMETYPCNFKGLKLNWQLLKDSLGAELTEEDMKMLGKVVGDDNLIVSSEYAVMNEKQKNIVDKHSYVFLDGLEEFGDEVLENIWKGICDEHPDENIVTDPLLIEQAYHQRFMDSRAHGFIGREDILGEIADYLNDTSGHKPLVLKGEPGSGKSALMAVAGQPGENELFGGYNIVRFVGASPASLDINKLVQSIIREIATHFEIAVDEQRINDVKVLYEYLREVLYKASAKGKLNIFIDAVNQLLPQYDPHYLLWLPKQLPDHIKIVISSIASEYTKNAEKHNLPFVRVGELAPDNCKKIVHNTLAEYRKTLNPKQMDMLLSKADAVKPLYLKVACEELRVFPSFELITSRIASLPDTIAELFMQFLERLEADHDPKLVKDTLCLIESSMYGLLESELLELLKPADKERLPVNTWAKLYRNLSPYLMNAGDEKEGLLEFFHPQLSLAVKTRYLKNEEITISYCKQLADYGLFNYNLKNGNTINSVLYTGIYLYKSLEEKGLYYLLRDLFTSDYKTINLYKSIAENLYDWVINNFDFEHEARLKSVTEKLAKNDFPHQFGSFLDNKGTLVRDNGKIRWALEFFEEDQKVMEKLVANEPQRTDVRRELATCYINVGQIYQAFGEGRKGLEFFEKSLKVLEILVALEPNKTDFRRDLATSFYFVGQIYNTLGKGQEVFEFFEKSLKVMEDLVALEPSRMDFRRGLAVSFDNVGNIYIEKGERLKALEFFEKSLKVKEDLATIEPSSIEFRRDLAVGYTNLANHEARFGGQKAFELYIKSLKVMEELVALEPRRIDFKRDLSINYNNVGNTYRTMGEIKKALEFFEKQKNTLEELVAVEPSRTDFRRDLSVSFNFLGLIYKEMGEEKRGIFFLEESIKVLEELVAIEPGRFDIREDLYVTFNFVARIYTEIGEGQKALGSFEESIIVLEELIALEPNRIDIREDLNVTLNFVNRIYTEIGAKQKALEFFKKSKKIKEALAQNFSSLGYVFASKKEGKKALEILKKSLKIIEELLALEPGNTDYKVEYAIIHWNIYHVCYEDEMLNWLNKTKDILEPLVKNGVQHPQLKQLWDMVNREIGKL